MFRQLICRCRSCLLPGVTCACGSVWVTSNRHNLLQYSRFGAPRRHMYSPDIDVHLQVPVGREGFPAFNLVKNLKSLECAGDHADKRGRSRRQAACAGSSALQLWGRMRACGMFTSAYVDCIATGAPHRHVFLNPHESPSNANAPKLFFVVMSHGASPLAAPESGCCHIKAIVSSLDESCGTCPPHRTASPSRRAVSAADPRELCAWRGIPW